METKLISVDEILATEYPPQDFILQPRLLPRGGCMLIGAATGVGKSWVALHIAQCFASGTPLFNAFYHKHGKEMQPKYPLTRLEKIIYIDYELQHATRKERFQRNLPAGLGLYFPSDPSLYGLDNERFRALEHLIAAHTPELLILDPLSSAHLCEENTNQIKQALNRLDQLRTKYGLSVLLVHHASSKTLRNKDSEEVQREPIEMFRGHTTIVDWADLAIALYPLNRPDEEAGSTKSLRLSFAKTRHTQHRKPTTISIDYTAREVGETSND